MSAVERAAEAIRALAVRVDEPGVCLKDERECFRKHPIHVGAMGHGVVDSVAVWDDDPDEPGVVYLEVESLARVVAAAAGLLAEPTDQGVVYREESWPRQWIGTCPRHSGGIRCNTRDEAVRFVDALCREQNCGRLPSP